MKQLVFWLASTVFFVIYAAQKYLAVPQESFNPAYITSTSIVVFMTALLPFCLAWFLKSRFHKPVSIIIALIVPGVLAAIGFASYWYFFILSFAPDIAVTTVLPRALMPGLIMGVILTYHSIVLTRR